MTLTYSNPFSIKVYPDDMLLVNIINAEICEGISIGTLRAEQGDNETPSPYVHLYLYFDLFFSWEITCMFCIIISAEHRHTIVI